MVDTVLGSSSGQDGIVEGISPPAEPVSIDLPSRVIPKKISRYTMMNNAQRPTPPLYERGAGLNKTWMMEVFIAQVVLVAPVVVVAVAVVAVRVVMKILTKPNIKPR